MKKALLFFALLCAVLFPLSAGGRVSGQQNVSTQEEVSAPQKFALVIGNGAYTGITRLNNPVNDAADMKTALESLGWTVDLVSNGNLDQMEGAVIRLKTRLAGSRDSYGLFFYAGHGVQSNGENYLIPVDANIASESFLRIRALSLSAALDELNDAGNALNIVVLDACRDNPFGWSRSGSRGLALTANQPADSIIVYATSAGSTAADGTGRNGLFTTHLLNNLKKPGLSVRELLDQTGADVQQASGRAQVPAIYSQFFGVAYLGSAPRNTPAPRPVTPVQPISPAPERPVPANMVWVEGGTFRMGSPASEAERYDNETQHQVTVASFYMGKYEVTQAEYEQVMGTNPSYFKGANLPVENVSWYEALEFCNALSLKEGLTPAYTIRKDRSDPNNTDTHDNLRWLVTWNRASNGYRLPTEAEWEYACRAGTLTPFNTGNNISTNIANYDGNHPYNNGSTGVYRERTTAAGSFAPNPWGLYDMHGNVWEWCWDWYGAYADSPQTDPAGPSTGANRVLRGGSWLINARYLRSAYRGIDVPSFRNSGVGFRLVRP